MAHLFVEFIPLVKPNEKFNARDSIFKVSKQLQPAGEIEFYWLQDFKSISAKVIFAEIGHFWTKQLQAAGETLILREA